MKIEELYIGQAASLSRKFTTEDVVAFSDMCLDKNPVHLDADYAERSFFKGRIVYGYLTASLFSGVIGSILPGKGSIYLNQNLNFRKPVYHGETITATCTITNIRKDKPIVTLETVAKNEKGDIVVDGTALIKLYQDE